MRVKGGLNSGLAQRQYIVLNISQTTGEGKGCCVILCKESYSNQLLWAVLSTGIACTVFEDIRHWVPQTLLWLFNNCHLVCQENSL